MPSVVRYVWEKRLDNAAQLGMKWSALPPGRGALGRTQALLGKQSGMGLPAAAA